MTDSRPPLSDLGRHIFEMAVGMNKIYAAGLGIDLPGHHAQVERMQEKLDQPIGGSWCPEDALAADPPQEDFERSVPSLPEGKAACFRTSCQRIVDCEQLSARGWCPACEKQDLTRVQLRKGDG